MRLKIDPFVSKISLPLQGHAFHFPALLFCDLISTSTQLGHKAHFFYFIFQKNNHTSICKSYSIEKQIIGGFLHERLWLRNFFTE